MEAPVRPAYRMQVCPDKSGLQTRKNKTKKASIQEVSFDDGTKSVAWLFSLE